MRKQAKTEGQVEMEIDSEVVFNQKDDPVNLIINMFTSLNPTQQYNCIFQILNNCGPSQLLFVSQSIGPSLKRDFIKMLPVELCLYILSLLDLKSLCRAAKVNRHWNGLIENDQILWFKIASSIAGKAIYSNPKMGFKDQAKRYYILDNNWKTGNNTKTITSVCHLSNVVTCLQFDSDKIITGSDDSLIKIWNPLDGSLIRSLVGHVGGVWALQFIDNILVSGSTDRTLRVWDIETGECLRELIGHSSTVRCLQMTKDKVVSGSRDQTLRIWDIATGKCLFILQGHTSSVRCVAVVNNIIVSGSYDCTCRMWDINTGECILELTGHTQRIYSLAFDGKHIASGSQDATIRVYSASTGTLIHSLAGHRSLVGNLQLDGNYLLSGNTDSTVRMWNIETGQCLYRLQGHVSGVSCLYFDETRILTGSDRVLKLWDRKTGAFIRDVIEDVDVVWRLVATENMCIAAIQISGIASLRIIHFEP